MTTQEERLREAINNKELAIFCGAGISMLPPSCLPNWWRFNETVLEEARKQALQALSDLDPETRSEIQHLSLNDLSVVSFSDELVKSFAGDSWFPILEVLDSDKPNANHYALAELAAQGMLRAIVTTNFDTLIERAFREQGVKLKVLVKPEDYLGLSYDDCILFKIHGTTKDATSLVDTASQKLSGLPTVVRSTLSLLFSNYHFLFLGFSGADLAFSEDYLGVAKALPRGLAITWLLPPGRRPADEVSQIIQQAGPKAGFLEGALPDFFDSLGIVVTKTAGSHENLQREADEKARLAIRDWLAMPYIGSLVCAVYIQGLLFRASKFGAAEKVQNLLTHHPMLAGPHFLPHSAVAMFHLARNAIERRQLEEGLKWLHQCLQIHMGLLRSWQMENVPIDAELQEEIDKNLSAVWVNIAVCQRLLGKDKDASHALQVALPLAHASSDDSRLGEIHLNYAAIEYDTAGPDDVLKRLDTARTHLARAGSTNGLFDVEHLTARQLLDIGEYDRAKLVLERAKKYCNLLAGGLRMMQLKQLESELLLRRGNIDDAIALIQEVLKDQTISGNLKILQRFQISYCRLFGFYEPVRDNVLQVLDQLIATMSPANSLLSYRESLEKRELPPAPPFLIATPGQKEDALRLQICESEFKKNIDHLPALFESLFQYCYERHSPRLVELAWAYLEAAKRGKDGQSIQYAERCMGVAYDVSGDLDKAKEIYESILANSPSPSNQAIVQQHLALVYSEQGKVEEADALFLQAASRFKELRNITEFVRCQMTFAKHLLRTNRLNRAEQVVKLALDQTANVTDPRARPALENILEAIQTRRNLKVWPAELDRFKLNLPQEQHVHPSELERLRKLAVVPEDYGSLSLHEWDSGNKIAAWHWSHKALSDYSTNGNLLGISRCLNNQAMFHAQDGNLEEACNLTRQALEIREREGDVQGQILTLSNLASYSFRAGKTDQSENSANRCLRLAVEAGMVNEPAGIAAIMLAFIYLMGNRILELLDHVQKFAPHIKAVTIDGLSHEREQLLELISSLSSASPTYILPGTNRGSFEEWLGTAIRWSKVGDIAKMNQVLNNPPKGMKLTLGDRARVEGTRANGLQSAGRQKEAVKAYKRAATMFQQAGVLDFANIAKINAGNSLRYLRQWDQAIKLLKEALNTANNNGHRTQINMGIASVWMERYAVAEEEADSNGKERPSLDALDKAQKYLEAAEATLEGSGSLRGYFLVKKANLRSLLGDRNGAKELFRDALVCLRRDNSRHVETIEQALQELDEDNKISSVDL